MVIFSKFYFEICNKGKTFNFSYLCKTRNGHLGLGNTEEASGRLRKPGLNQGLVGAYSQEASGIVGPSRYVYDKIVVQTDQKNGLIGF